MPDPTESRFSRYVRWAGLILLYVAVVVYNSDFKPDNVWRALAGIAVPIALYLAIRSVIVDPILEKMRELEYKIDRLGGKRTPWD